MRTNRAKIQWMMVYIIFFAILLWGGREIVPELYRRWSLCRRMAAYHANQAALYPPVGRAAAHQMELSAKYRHALYVPWEFWSLGDHPPLYANP